MWHWTKMSSYAGSTLINYLVNLILNNAPSRRIDLLGSFRYDYPVGKYLFRVNNKSSHENEKALIPFYHKKYFL